MRQPLVLLACCVGIAFSAPGPVKNLKAVQEAFGGIVSLSWEKPDDFPAVWKDFYEIKVTDENNAPVAVDNLGTTYGNDTSTIITIHAHEAGKTFKVTLAPVTEKTNEKGQSTTVTITLQDEKSAIPAPTNLQYAGLDYERNYVQWEWKGADGVEYKNVRFFVLACDDKAEQCRMNTTTEKSTVLSDLGYNLDYNVKVFAHADGAQDSDPPKTSLALPGRMPHIEFLDFPAPKKSRYVRPKINANQDRVNYTVRWTMAERKADQKLIGIAVIICNMNTSVCDPLGEPTKGYVDKLEVDFSRDTEYEIHIYAVYDMGLNQRYNRFGFTFNTSDPTDPDKPDKDSKGFPAWAIILIIVAILAVLGGAGYYYKNRSNKY